MSVITAKTEFAYDAPAQYSQTQYSLPLAGGSAASGGSAAPRRGLLAALRWVMEQPRRRAVINELQSLTDHELADIGLTRNTLSSVFDRDFANSRAV